MGAFKFFTLIVIGGYIIVQLFSIVVQSEGPRDITVYKRNYRDSDAYIKGYTVDGTKTEVFDVEVKPASFWDWLLLTQNDENVLAALLKITTALIFGRYVLRVDYDTLFSKRIFNLFLLGLLFWIAAYGAVIIGGQHTSVFYSDLYASKGGDKLVAYYGFQPRLRFDRFNHDYWLYAFVPLILIGFYKTFKKFYTGGPEEDW